MDKTITVTFENVSEERADNFVQTVKGYVAALSGDLENEWKEKVVTAVEAGEDMPAKPVVLSV